MERGDRRRRPASGTTGRSTAGPIELLAEDARLEVEDALAEAAARRRPAVVDDVRRQDRHHRRLGAVRVAVEVVADRAVVDDEQRPHVVGVGRVRVVGEPRVEHLADALGRAASRRGSRRRRPVPPSQDRTRPGGVGPPSVRSMEPLVALVGFSFVSSVTPGPNNVLLWASGAEFGFRRTCRTSSAPRSGSGRWRSPSRPASGRSSRRSRRSRSS